MESKILYSLMLDRASLSAKNGWLDEEGKVFIYYKLDRIMTDMQRIDVMERGSINSMTDHYLKELLKPLQEQCIEDRDKCAKIAHIEITFFYLLNWQDMKCFQKEIKHDPEMYAEMVSIIFRHDGDDPEERKTEEFRNYAQVIHRLFDI